jgi:hypothetical protein
MLPTHEKLVRGGGERLKPSRISAATALFVRYGALAAAALSGLLALPSLHLPFLSDDWSNLAAVEHGLAARTPFNYFRPLYLASYWAELRAWGLSPALSHLVNLLLVAFCAALVVVLTKRYTEDPRLAALTGIIFAIHPYHVENVAWVAARADSMCAALVFLAALLYDRWRERMFGVPIAAILAFEAALLSKETAVVLPLFLILLGVCDRRRRPERGEWARGLIPIVVVALVHFTWLRPPTVTGPGLDLWAVVGPAGWKRLANYLTAALLPAQGEVIETHPMMWFLAAVGTGLVITALARSASRIPTIVWGASAAFLILLGPDIVVAFQQRYYLLPSAASAVVLAAMLLHMRARTTIALCTLLFAGWLVALGAQWLGWLDAGAAGKTLITGLVEASRTPGVREIVVANAPNRIHGQPVACVWNFAIRLSGGRSIKVVTAPSLDYAWNRESILNGPREGAVRLSSEGAEIFSVIPRRRFSRYIAPELPVGTQLVERAYATIELSSEGVLHVRIYSEQDGSRAAYLWSMGTLERLF